MTKGSGTALTEMVSALGDVLDLRMNFKVVSVESQENGSKPNFVTTRQLVELAAGTSDCED